MDGITFYSTNPLLFSPATAQDRRKLICSIFQLDCCFLLVPEFPFSCSKYYMPHKKMSVDGRPCLEYLWKILYEREEKYLWLHRLLCNLRVYLGCTRLLPGTVTEDNLKKCIIFPSAPGKGQHVLPIWTLPCVEMQARDGCVAICGVCTSLEVWACRTWL